MNMNDRRKRVSARKPRIGLTDRDLEHLFEIHGTDSAAVLARRTGLPYLLIYNIVHRRVMSVSYRHFMTLYGRPAPQQAALKVDGAPFRAMAELWLFLNAGINRADLYRELFGLESHQKTDHRIFNGKVKAVDARLEHIMRQKFSDAGVDTQLLNQWLDEFDALPHSDWVPYTRIRPALVYLWEKLGVHPTSVLKQSVVRYETGLLKRVSRSIADRIVALKNKTEKELREEGKQDTEKIKESLVGGKHGYTLYSDIRDELLFLRRTTRRGAKYYLGRSPWTYENGRAKRIANWRARKILQDCDRFIRQSPDTPLASLPQSRQRAQVQRLIDVMVARTAQLLSDKDGIAFEKRILRPSHTRVEYSNPYHGLTPFDMASRVLGMKPRAFDLMVARNCEIFRSVGKFAQRWYLPDLYLRELSRKKDFGLISAKYELMAKAHHRQRPIDACMN
ncbi:MAG: hypothetical protein V2I40_14585 [Desulfobacteraceae bacterium]|jgi:hypothetical protein|nr:hypothetical protein [Desulfobacteraceae bacterium]